jgi:L-rhamnonate dehydratase
MLVTRVETPRIRTVRERTGWLNETVIANPMSIYPEHHARRSSWRYVDEALVLVHTDTGHVGIGAPIPAHAREIVSEHFARFLVGREASDVERLWDQMYRASLPYGRKGAAIMALSSVDIALWDLIAKEQQVPLWRALGGRTHEVLATYATCHDVRAAVSLGFTAFKIPMPHGPADGADGMLRNEEVVAAAREAAGPDADLMIDCYMGWTVEYTVRMAKRLEPYRLRWIEEALPPDDIDGSAELVRRIDSTVIATGEHEFTRWGFKELIARRACDVVQPDLAWCGGITEARRIAAIASAWDLSVVPHAGGLQPWTLHFVTATVNAGVAEVVVLPHEDGARIRPLHPYLRGIPLPEAGMMRAGDGPGVGVEVDEGWLA